MKEGKNDDNKTRGSSLADGEGNVLAKSSSVSFASSYQNHIKYPEYAAWCRSIGGTPTVKGFRTWHSKQKPQWQNRVKEVSEESGYELEGNFFTKEEAIQRGKNNPELLTKFQPAVKRDGKIIKKP